ILVSIAPQVLSPKVSEFTPVFIDIIKLHLRQSSLHGRREAVGRLKPMEIKIEKETKIVGFREYTTSSKKTEDAFS
ncbi:MAG: hypothetical protein KAT88_12400, partial [Spirochaetes bacterium]|nr:hypothetical protein [Spirochaetota bacterium]